MEKTYCKQKRAIVDLLIQITFSQKHRFLKISINQLKMCQSLPSPFILHYWGTLVFWVFVSNFERKIFILSRLICIIMFMFSDQYSQLYDLNMGIKYHLPLYYFFQFLCRICRREKTHCYCYFKQQQNVIIMHTNNDET